MKPLQLPVLIALLLGSIASFAQAADFGSISGRVTDKHTGHAIPFASVSLPAAKRGGLTDSEGGYTISNVPPGTYEVRVQYLGYKAGSNAAVVVTAGKVTTANFLLEDVVVHEEKQVEVSAERRLVEVKQGATMRSVTANDIQHLAVTTVSDVLQQQAGVSTDAEQIHIRGGRSDETVFVVNGVANRDLVTGQSTAGEINARSVSEVNVATGAYDVRYGNALSGVVEIKLKEAPARHHARHRQLRRPVMAGGRDRAGPGVVADPAPPGRDDPGYADQRPGSLELPLRGAVHLPRSGEPEHSPADADASGFPPAAAFDL